MAGPITLYFASGGSQVGYIYPGTANALLVDYWPPKAGSFLDLQSTNFSPGTTTGYSLQTFLAGAPAAFTGTPLPSAAPNGSDSGVSALKYTGIVDPGVWTIGVSWSAQIQSGATVSACLRLWRGSNPTGSGAVEITSAIVETNSIVLSSSPANCSATVTLGSIRLSDEHIFIQVACHSIGPGVASADAAQMQDIITTGIAALVTPNFTATIPSITLGATSTVIATPSAGSWASFDDLQPGQASASVPSATAQPYDDLGPTLQAFTSTPSPWTLKYWDFDALPSGLATGSAVGTAAGTSTAVGHGAATARSAGTTAGTSTATGHGAATKRSSSSVAGGSTAIGHGAATARASSTAAGTSTATAHGAATARASSTAAGTSTATGHSAATARSSATAAGTSTAVGHGAATARSAATVAGTSTATGHGAATARASSTAAGTSTATAHGAATARASSTAAGTSTATAHGAATARAAGTAAGSSTATAFGRAADTATGTAAGTSTATGHGIALVAAVGTAAGASTATAVGRSTAQAVGTAAGSAVVTGVSPGAPVTSWATPLPADVASALDRLASTVRALSGAVVGTSITSGNFASTPPATFAQALDRIAATVEVLNGASISTSITSGNFGTPVPTTVAQALDRIATAVRALYGSPIP